MTSITRDAVTTGDQGEPMTIAEQAIVLVGKCAVYARMENWKLMEAEFVAALSAERERCANLAETMALERREKEAKRGFGPETARPIANQYWCEEIADAIRRGDSLSDHQSALTAGETG